MPTPSTCPTDRAPATHRHGGRAKIIKAICVEAIAEGYDNLRDGLADLQARVGDPNLPWVHTLHLNDRDQLFIWDEANLRWHVADLRSVQKLFIRLLKKAGVQPGRSKNVPAKRATPAPISIVQTPQSQTSSRSTEVGEVGQFEHAPDHGGAGSSPPTSTSPTSDNSIIASTITAIPVLASASPTPSTSPTSNRAVTTVDPDAPTLDAFADPWPEEAGAVDVADPVDPDWARVLHLLAHHGPLDAVTIAEPGSVPGEHIDAFRARLGALGIDYLGFIESDTGTHVHMFVPRVFTETVRAVYLAISGSHDRGPGYPVDRVFMAKPVDDPRGWLKYCRKSGGERL